MHEILCQISSLDRHQPYGGLSTLFAGDLKQLGIFFMNTQLFNIIFLAPVKDPFIFKPPTIHGRSRAAENLWGKYINYHLTEKIRSSDDQYFSSLCDRVGMNECTQEDLSFLKNRDIPCPLAEDPENFKNGKVVNFYF